MKKGNHLVYTRFCFRPAQKNITLLRTSFLRFSNISQSEKPVQRRLQIVENKGSHQRNQEWHSTWTRNVRRHEMYSTWFSNDVICFRACCGGVKLPFLVLPSLPRSTGPWNLTQVCIRTAFYERNYEFTSQTWFVAHASSRLFSGRNDTRERRKSSLGFKPRLLDLESSVH